MKDRRPILAAGLVPEGTRMPSSIKRSLSRASNACFVFLVGNLGANAWGAKVLSVRGRTSGTIRSVPVNPLERDGVTYLVAPRGETQWVRNLRVAGEGNLKRGRAQESFQVVRELPPDERPPILQAYLDRWYWQVGKIMDVPKSPSSEDLARIAATHPVFEISITNQVPADKG